MATRNELVALLFFRAWVMVLELFRANDRLHGGYHSVNTEQGQRTGDDPEIDGQLALTGQCAH
jgi:hypothetical protein